jgi:iron complex outermembrane receptor protein/hemoglobin/transferrin/lactoferrin receptor protein
MWKLTILCSVLTAGLTMAPPFAEPDGSVSDEGNSSVPEESNEAPAVQDDVATNTRLIYSINRTPEPLFETARAAQVITIDDIWRRNARTLPEVLMEEAGIFVQQSNFGGGSPIIRGFMGKQILIMIDGVRANNSTYRLGPMQYLSNIDINMVERIEVVRGVGSVLGSDALGGTINVITKKGPPAGRQDNVGASVFSRLSSADGGFIGRVEGYGATDRMRYSGGITYRSSGDVESGGRLQTPAGYDEQAGNADLEFFVSDDKTLSFHYQDLQQNQVPGTDKITVGQYLVYDYDLLKLQLARVAYQDLSDRGWSNFFQVTGFWNQQNERSRQVAAGLPFVELAPVDRQDVFGINLEMVRF